MKNSRLFFLSMLLIGSFSASAQSDLPGVTVEDMRGNKINTATLHNDGKPIILSFWATWCKPCIKELQAIQEVYEDWQEETGVKLIAMSVDDSRTASTVRSYVFGSGWDYEVYLDLNGDFKRAMNVVNVPHTFLLDGQGNVVYQHTSYAPGDEEDLYQKILALKK